MEKSVCGVGLVAKMTAMTAVTTLQTVTELARERMVVVTRLSPLVGQTTNSSMMLNAYL